MEGSVVGFGEVAEDEKQGDEVPEPQGRLEELFGHNDYGMFLEMEGNTARKGEVERWVDVFDGWPCCGVCCLIWQLGGWCCL